MGKGDFFFLCLCPYLPKLCCFQHLLTQDCCLESSLSFFLQTHPASAVLPLPWHMELRSRHPGDPQQHKSSFISVGKEAWRGNIDISPALLCPQSCDLALLSGAFLCKTSEHTCRRGSPGSVPCTLGTLPSPGDTHNVLQPTVIYVALLQLMCFVPGDS